MDDMTEYLVDRWAEIEATNTQGGGRWKSKNLPVRADERLLVLAIDNRGQRHLLVPKWPGELAANTRSPLAVAPREFSFAGDDGESVEGAYLDIHCQIRNLNGQFDKVIADVIEEIQTARDAAAAAAATVASWRRLFATLADSGGLSYHQRLALFGELSVLQDLVETVPEFEANWWSGPLREPHDFSLPDVTVEVKAIGEDSSSVRVHGLDQLEPRENEPLFLVIRKIAETASGRTLAELFGEVLSAADDRKSLRERAAMVGVTDTDPDAVRFGIVETLVGRVDVGFPRIRPADVQEDARDVICRVEYDLDVVRLRSHLAPGRVSEIFREVL